MLDDHDAVLEEDVSRRGFFKMAIALFNGLIALALAIPGLGYLLTPVVRKTAATWVSLGPLDDFPPGEPRKAVFTYTTQSGYTQQQRQGFVWVRVHPDGEDQVTVLSAVCTHTGCNVAWHTDVDQFICPCHNGTYNIQGEVVAGPPPKPLPRLPVRIERGELQVQLTA